MRINQSENSLSQNQKSPSIRSGLTLLEVVISTAVFMAAAAVILNLIRTGTVASSYSQLTTEAAFRAETVLGEILSEVRPMESVGESPFEDDEEGGWFFSVDRESGDDSDLVLLKVRAWFSVQDQTVASVTLDRMVRDPALWEEAAMAAAEAEEESGGRVMLRAYSKFVWQTSFSKSPRAVRKTIPIRIRRGFTLLEVLIALALMVLLLSVVYGVMDSYFQLSEYGRMEAKRAQIARAVFDRISVDIRAVVFEPVEEELEEGEEAEGLTTVEPDLSLVSTDEAFAAGIVGLAGTSTELVMHIARPTPGCGH